MSEEEQRAIKGGTWYYIPQEDRLEFSGSGNDIKICMPDGNVPISGCSEASIIEACVRRVAYDHSIFSYCGGIPPIKERYASASYAMGMQWNKAEIYLNANAYKDNDCFNDMNAMISTLQHESKHYSSYLNGGNPNSPQEELSALDYQISQSEYFNTPESYKYDVCCKYISAYSRVYKGGGILTSDELIQVRMK